MFQPISQMRMPDGRTYREHNLEIPFSIPLGALVEIIPNPVDLTPEWNGVRMRIVQHDRDGDGTPIYRLGVGDGEWNHFKQSYNWFIAESLRVIPE